MEAWAKDEHRIGLHPVNRMVWVLLGEQLIASVNWKCGSWALQPTTGQTYWWIVPCLNFEVFSRLLEDFAQHFGVDEQKRVILLPDLEVGDKGASPLPPYA